MNQQEDGEQEKHCGGGVQTKPYLEGATTLKTKLEG